jgi:transposase
LRRVKNLADTALTQLSRLFEEMYSAIGRPSILPERLLKASLLMALYTVRSERLFCEQLDYNLLFRWFLDMDVAEANCFNQLLVGSDQITKIVKCETERPAGSQT